MKASGFSLVETLVVSCIVAILSAVIWMAAGPRLRAQAELRSAKSNLRQLAFAVNLYMSDNKDEPPISLRNVAIPGLSISDPRNGGQLIYTLGRLEVSRQGLGEFESFGFNPAVNSIIKCPGVNDWHGRTDTMMVPNGRGGFKPFEVPALGKDDKLHLLGVRLDGSTGWFDTFEGWEKDLPKPMPIGSVKN